MAVNLCYIINTTENKLDTSSDPFSPPPPSSAPPPPVRNSTSKTLERRKLGKLMFYVRI